MNKKKEFFTRNESHSCEKCSSQ